MDGPYALLFAGAEPRQRLKDAASSLGLPLERVRPSLEQILARLRAGPFRAIVVDREAVAFDLLECALNVRDVDEQVPIIIIADREGRSAKDLFLRLLLHREHGTHVVSADSTAEKFASKLASVLGLEKRTGGKEVTCGS